MARLFNSNNSDYIRNTSTPNLSLSVFTISFWLNVRNFELGVTVDMMQKGSSGSDYGFQTYQDGTLFYHIVSNTSATFLLSTNTWYHLLGTYDAGAGGNNKNLYINGTFNIGVAEGSFAAPVSPGIGFGNFPDLSGNYGHLTGADGAIWNVILSPLEIAALGKGVRPPVIRPRNLVGYWPLDGLQSPEPDLSGNAYNGTVNGTTKDFGPPFMTLTPRRPQFQVPPPPTIIYPTQAVAAHFGRRVNVVSY
jgi:hypothetical protein